MKKIIFYLLTVVLLSGLFFGCAPAPSKEIKFEGTMLLPAAAGESKAFVDFVNKVNEKAGGELVIDVLGGPEVIPGIEQVEAIRTGVVDISFGPMSYHQAILPPSGAMFLATDTPWEQRESGFFDLMVEAYKELNLHFLGRLDAVQGFYLYTNSRIENPREDFKGLKMRTIGGVFDELFVKALGATPTFVPRADLYSAMERGVLDGHMGNPSIVKRMGIHEVTNYIIKHKFYQSDLVILVNLDSWNALPKNLQELLEETVADYEQEWWSAMAQWNEEDLQAMIAEGVEVIEFSPDDAKWYLDQAYKPAWEEFYRMDPEWAARLEKVM